MPLISTATRNEFREVLVEFVTREIDMIFQGAGLTPKEDYDPPVNGTRRILVERYYASIDFNSPTDINKLLLAYGETILRRSPANALHPSSDNLHRLMKRDGYEFDGENFVPLPKKLQPPIESIRTLARSFDLPGLQIEIERLAHAAEHDPALAVGTAKEMVETICKTILEDRGVHPPSEDLPQLVRATARELSLLPDSIPDLAKGSEIIRRMLSNLNQVSQGIAELRNLYGTGHGRDGRFIGIQPRHARLAVGAAATLGTFLLETHLDRTHQELDERS